MYLKHPKAVEALQSYCQAIEEGNVVSTDLLKEGIPLDKSSFIDESLTKAKKIPLGTNKDGTPKGAKPSKSSKSSSKASGKDKQSLARAEAELRTLR